MTLSEALGNIATKTWDALITNWKTSGSALVASVACFIASDPEGFSFPTQVTTVAKFAMASGLLALGVAAKDHSKSGNPDLTKKENEEKNQKDSELVNVVSEVGKLSEETKT